MAIRLHSEKGVNPRVTQCRLCNKTVGIVLLGSQNHKYTCPECKTLHYGLPDRGKSGQRECQECKNRFRSDWKTEEIPDNESLPIEICDECQKKEEEVCNAVKAGGIFWRCKDCRSTGAIKAKSPLAKAVRKKMGIKPPEPCGIEFSKDDYCPVCGAKFGGFDSTKEDKIE